MINTETFLLWFSFSPVNLDHVLLSGLMFSLSLSHKGPVTNYPPLSSSGSSSSVDLSVNFSALFCQLINFYILLSSSFVHFIGRALMFFLLKVEFSAFYPSSFYHFRHFSSLLFQQISRNHETKICNINEIKRKKRE